MKSITQDMRYKQSLMEYSLKYGVSKASRKYNRARLYIYFWLKRYDGTLQSLQPQSKRPKHHPSEHTPEELKLIQDMRRRNPDLGMIELWHRLKKRGYTRRPESLYRVMKRLGMFKQEKAKKRYVPKPYEQMTYPGQRVQVDVKVVPTTVPLVLSTGFLLVSSLLLSLYKMFDKPTGKDFLRFPGREKTLGRWLHAAHGFPLSTFPET